MGHVCNQDIQPLISNMIQNYTNLETQDGSLISFKAATEVLFSPIEASLEECRSNSPRFKLAMDICCWLSSVTPPTEFAWFVNLRIVHLALIWGGLKGLDELFATDQMSSKEVVAWLKEYYPRGWAFNFESFSDW